MTFFAPGIFAVNGLRAGATRSVLQSVRHARRLDMRCHNGVRSEDMGRTMTDSPLLYEPEVLLHPFYRPPTGHETGEDCVSSGSISALLPGCQTSLSVAFGIWLVWRRRDRHNPAGLNPIHCLLWCWSVYLYERPHMLQHRTQKSTNPNVWALPAKALHATSGHFFMTYYDIFIFGDFLKLYNYYYCWFIWYRTVHIDAKRHKINLLR